MTIYGADNTFDTLHKHKTLQTHETHCSTTKPRYSPCFSHQIDMADCTRKINQELTLLETPTKYCITNAAKHAVKHKTKHAALHTPTKDITSTAKRLDISIISAAPFNHLVQQSQKNLNIQIFSVTLQDINIALAPKKHTNPATRLSSEYHNFLDIFSQKDADILPKHRTGYNYTIELMEGKTPTWGPLYSMSANELKMLKVYIKKMVDKSFVQASSSSAASPMFFAKKPSGSLHFCVNYQAFNAITVKNQSPLLLIKETLERVCKAKIFNKIDIIAAFNKLCIKQGEE